MEDNIICRLRSHALGTPDRTAFIILADGEAIENKIAYSELAASVDALSAHLAGMHLEGKRVLLIYQDIPEFIVAFLACQHTGIIAVPVSYIKGSKQIARLFNVMEDAQVAAVLCVAASIPPLTEGLADFLSSGKIEIIATDTVPLPILGNEIPEPAPNAISFIQYTSGSTGKPKGVVVSTKNLMHNQHLIRNAFGCNEESIIFSWLPFHHDMGLIGNILHTIYVGCTCVLMSPFHFVQSPRRWLAGISKYKATHSGGPNFAYDLCVEKIPSDELSGLDLSTWKVAYNGSEPIRAESLKRFADHFSAAGFQEHAIYPCYGLAEATLLVAGHKTPGTTPATILVNRHLIRNGKIVLSDKTGPLVQTLAGSGGIAPGMECRIISPTDRRECRTLEEGEICIAGESVTQGYWGKENDEYFYDIDGRRFLRTGDLGFFSNGELFVHGRIREMLIIRGQNIYPYDIEETVSRCDAALLANGVAVFSLHEREDELVVIAEVQRTQINGLDGAAVIRSIDKTVKGTFGIIPYDIILTTPHGIPRTTSGKLQRLQCRDGYLCNSFVTIASKLTLPPVQEEETKERLLPSAVLRSGDYSTIRQYLLEGIESKVGALPPGLADDAADLTEIGIDSIRATELINTINKELDINIEATRVFHDYTLRGLTNVLENMLWLKNGQVSGREIMI